MTWIIAAYHAASFFSLRPSNATASGGKTLLIPTPFALKMALLSTSIQTAGLEEGKQRFPLIRDMRIQLALPDRITAVKSFAKVRRPAEFKDASKRDEKIAELSERGAYPFQPTIAYREFVQFGDPLDNPQASLIRVACSSLQGETPSWVGEALLAINYLGKRGGFMQPMGMPRTSDTLDSSFFEITRDTETFDVNGTLQMLDDCGSSMTFDHADIYSPKRISLGKERLLRHVVLPYHLARSSRGYSLYERG